MALDTPILVAVLCAFIFSSCSSRTPVPGISSPRDELLRHMMGKNWFVRVITPTDTVQGRIRMVTNDSVRVGDRKLGVREVDAIERRVPIGDTGSRRGALLAGGVGLVLSVWIRPGLESFAETACDFQCSIGLHVFMPGALAIMGGLMGDAIVENRYRWEPVVSYR